MPYDDVEMSTEMTTNMEDAWTIRLVSEMSANVKSLPQWVRDALTAGYAKTIVLTAFVKYDRETSANVAYGVY